MKDSEKTARSCRDTIEALKCELRELVAQRDRVNIRMEKLQTAVTGLVSTLADPDEAVAQLSAINEIVGPIGTTEMVRHIFRSDPNATWTAVDIRDFLLRENFELYKYSNPLAAIHTILRRLQEAGDIGPADDIVIGGAYRWTGTAESERGRLLRQGGKRLRSRLSFTREGGERNSSR